MSLHPPRNRRATRRRLLPLVASLEDRRLLAGLTSSIVGPVSPTAITTTTPAITPTSTSTTTTRVDSNLSAPAINLGDSYWGGSDAGRIGLSRRTDQFVIGLTSSSISASGWVQSVKSQVGVLSNVSLNRSLSSQILVVDAGVKSDDAGKAFAILTQKMDAAAGQAGVAWVAPVFRTTETGSDLVMFNEVIAALKPGVSPSAFFASRPEVTSYRPLPGTPDEFVATLNVGAGVNSLKAIDTIAADTRVAWASGNFYHDYQKYYTPNDPLYASQWHLNNTGAVTGEQADADVDAPEAWDVAGGGSSNVVIAVVDDGMEITHPDLLANRFINTGEIAGDGIDNDGNGWVDDVSGWDFTGNDNDPGPSTTSDEHATSVAGVAAGVGDNNIGITGMAFNSKILPVRIFLGSTATTSANIASAVYYAAGRTANGLGQWRAGDVMNNSWGGGSADASITAAFTYASNTAKSGRGVATMIASGNGYASSISYPASLSSTLPGVVAVGASNDFDMRSQYSNYGTGLDVMAPSSGGIIGIITTDRQGANGYNTAGDYTTTASSYFGGTSSATPLTAGVAALVLSRDINNLTAAQIKLILRSTTDLIGGASYTGANGYATEYGYGRINAYQAVLAVGRSAAQAYTSTSLVASGGAVAMTTGLGTTVDRTIYVRNPGTLTTTLGSLAISGSSAFSIVSGLTSTSLGVGGRASFVVRYNPSAVGSDSAAVTFATSVPGAGTYTINLSGTATPAAVLAGRAYEDRDTNGAYTSSVDTPLVGWTAFLDQNGNGVYDNTTVTYSATGLPLLVPDPGNTVSTLNISGATGTILDLNVTLTINHTYDADLRLMLVSPTGIKVLLTDSNGGSGANYTGTIFDDQAATAITGGSAPFAGSYKPMTPLSALNGSSLNGAWKLVLVDDFAPDQGTLVSWSITAVTASEPSVLTDSTGSYQFTGLAAGGYTVRLQTPAGWNTTSPASGAYTPSLTSPTQTIGGLDFNLLQANAIYGLTYHDRNGNGSRSANEELLPGWSVYNDKNNNGVRDLGTAITYPSSNVPVAIPDNTTVTSTLALSGLSGTISDINVLINITHTWDSDLTVALVAPNGTVVTLTSALGSSGDNYTNTLFDDQAAASITTGTAPFTGSFRPIGSLASLNGISPNGTWTLRITDSASGDTGTLTGWSLIINHDPNAEASYVSDSTGVFVVSGVAPGAVLLREEGQTGWKTTGPASGAYSATMTAGASLTGAAFGNQLLNTIYGQYFQDTNANGAVDASESGLSGKVVFIDKNNNGVFDSGTAVTYPSSNVPVAIPDNTTVTSTLALSGLSGTILDVNVLLNITHTWDGDLTVVLVAPNGVSVTLVARRGSSGDNFTNTIFDDQASTSITTGSAPFTGSFRPESVLSALNGISPNGTWTLRVTDSASGDTGTLTGWSLIINHDPNAEVSTTTDASGNYDFRTLSPGTYPIKSLPVAAPLGLRFTAPATGAYNVSLASGATSSNNNFGLAPASVASATIDDGTAQRSMVRSITIDVAGTITAAPGSAFTLTRVAGGTPLSFGVTVASITSLGANGTRLVLTFTGTGLVGGSLKSLPDGVYELVINGDAIVNGGTALDADGDGTAGGTKTVTFQRFFGDSNGDGQVDATDYAAFRTAYLTGNATLYVLFDFNGDGVFDSADLAGFLDNFRKRTLG